MDGLTTFIAKYLLVVPAVAVVYIWLKLHGRPRRNFLILLIGGGLLSLILAEIARHLYYNPRPFLSDGVKPLFSASRDNGFPSDHTLAAAALAYASLSYSKKLGWGLLAAAVLIGWARVYGGVHHAVDVIGSLVIAGLAYLSVNYLIKSRSKDD